MAAPLGNQFWKARSSHGRKPIFASPEQLQEACEQYFAWAEANPLYEDKIIAFQGAATHVPTAKLRALTIGGLCLFLDISRQGWTEYKAKQDFSGICEGIEEAIREQKFTGAAADLLNPAIIARDLGLADRQEHTGANGGPIQTEEVSDLQAARAIAFVLQSAAKKQD